uniref:Cystatin domain-containing protein n=1 Tax=Pygocentrus nattereri TaxID=42514 RepID=A0AAR2KSL8_PYGNA
LCVIFLISWFQLKPEVEEKTGKTFTVFEALMYRKQIVEGTNYELKVLMNLFLIIEHLLSSF